jgi:hypothetical protein
MYNQVQRPRRGDHDRYDRSSNRRQQSQATTRQTSQKVQEQLPARRPYVKVATWRSTMTVAIVDNFGLDQINIRQFLKRELRWVKQFRFYSEDEFAEFIETLQDAADIIEDDDLLKNPAPPDVEVPPLAEKRYVEPQVIKVWRRIMRVVITDNRGYDQIEVQMNSRDSGWNKVFYFRSLDDFDDFTKVLDEASEKIEKENLIKFPYPQRPDQQSPQE